MKRLLLSSLFFVAGVGGLYAGTEAQAEFQKLQGTWLVVSLAEEGKAVPKKETDLLEMTFTKDELKVTEQGKVVAHYRIKLDPSKNPKEINFTHLMGESQDKTEPGIYVFEGNVLKMALDESRKSRPKVFEGKETASYSVIVLTKKPADKK